MTRISVFGLGHVGLATALCLARRGHIVTGIDPDTKKVEIIQSGRAPFYEPQLDAYVQEAVTAKMLIATADPQANSKSEITFITVGTPSNSDGSINLSHVRAAAKDIGRSLRGRTEYQLIIVKSTVTPGTARNIIKPSIEKASGKKCGDDFGLCSNPEFLREGHAIEDTENPDRIIIGSEDARAAQVLEDFYREFHKSVVPPIVRTSHEKAELIKYANNAFLATKISFINTIAEIAERTPNADVTTVASAIGLDPRIGSRFLDAGLGYGGSCFPKDLDALIAHSRTLGYNPILLESTVKVNKKQPFKAVTCARRKLKSLRGKRIAILGLSFKPDTEDMREAVSIPIIKTLLRQKARIIAYDPKATENAKRIFGKRIEYAANAKECVKEAELAIVVTEWEEFKQITPEDFRRIMKNPVVFDGRRIFDPKEMIKAGILYDAIGLGPLAKS